MPLVTSALCCGRNRRGRAGHRADRQPGTGARKCVGHGGAKIDFPERNKFRESARPALAAYKKVKLFFALKTLDEIRVEFENRPDDTA
jgi:hypothetical protein